jgi:hypothetical protein
MNTRYRTVHCTDYAYHYVCSTPISRNWRTGRLMVRLLLVVDFLQSKLHFSSLLFSIIEKWGSHSRYPIRFTTSANKILGSYEDPESCAYSHTSLGDRANRRHLNADIFAFRCSSWAPTFPLESCLRRSGGQISR